MPRRGCRHAGLGAVAVSFQRIDHTGHLRTNGEYIDNGRSLTAALFLEVDYGITRRVSVTAGIPLVFARYTDDDLPPPFIPFYPLDECRCWHQGWQDFSLTARFNLLDTFDHVLAVTPSVTVGLPSHAYVHRGEAVIGRDLRELRLAIDAGRRLDEISPRLTVTGNYAYTVVDPVLGVRTDRSNATVEIVARAMSRLAVRGFLAVQRTHGGLRGGPFPGWEPPFGEVNTPARLLEHDRLLRDNRIHVGFGGSYHLTRGDAFATYTHFVTGSDSHAGHAFTAGFSVPFRINR